ncbi:hypothetical protein [Enterococcus faecalis]|uniref:hypothetical protein n=1 Tax=Enterococcus faecalis TaxID=1351 RepID=UPI002FBF0E36
MLMLNQEILFIRVNKYEYLLKKGTISNYSFNIIDEEKLGFLTLVFEDIVYPIKEQDIETKLINELNICEEKVSDILKKLKDVEILIDKAKEDRVSICILAPNEIKDQISKRTKEILLNEVRIVDINEVDYKNIVEEIVFLAIPYYSPTILHDVDEFCVKNNKKLFVTYCDGDEGVIVPLMANDGLCYNDYEILRESSLYNLVDYKVMKEHLIVKKTNMKIQPFKWEYVLMSSLLIFKQHLENVSINSFAYSIDIERFIFTKSKLFRFPKNSLSQSDVNIKHPFI